LNAQTAHMRSKVAYNLLWILGAASIALGGILFLFVGRQLAFPLLGLGIFYLAWPILVFPIRVKRDYKKQTQLMGPQVLTTSEAGIRFKGDNFESETQRSLFGKMRETKQVFMLYVVTEASKYFLSVHSPLLSKRSFVNWSANICRTSSCCCRTHL